MAERKKIIIAGFPGSGKTSFLKAISADTPFGWDKFDDLDDLIAKKYKNEVPFIIKLEGWEKFRQKELTTLKEWIQGDFDGVLALGGGTLTKEIFASLKPIKGLKLVHLRTDFDTCWKRAQVIGAPNRPLFEKGREECENIYREREIIFNLIPWKIDNPDDAKLSTLARQFWVSILTS